MARLPPPESILWTRTYTHEFGFEVTECIATKERAFCFLVYRDPATELVFDGKNNLIFQVDFWFTDSSYASLRPLEDEARDKVMKLFNSYWGKRKMRDIRKFATAEHPLRASGLGGFIKCPWRNVMSFLSDSGADESGQAADTGSAMHAATEAFHKGADLAASLEAMKARAAEFPRADLNDAANLFLCYAADVRNSSADVVLCEREVNFCIKPAPEDPTQEMIHIQGHVDQVRRKEGRLSTWDVKTSKRDPVDLVYTHTFQVAAYCVGASAELGEMVHPGGLILPRRYTKDFSNSPVHIPFPWKFQDIEQILSPIRSIVARVRSGDVWHVPSREYCQWCAARGPDLCLPRLQDTLRLLRRT